MANRTDAAPERDITGNAALRTTDQDVLRLDADNTLRVDDENCLRVSDGAVTTAQSLTEELPDVEMADAVERYCRGPAGDCRPETTE